MTESANTLQGRKVTTRHRITVAAQQLTDAHGYDGFTMDELADAAGVSRRTLFNYFPGKLDAVLGATFDLAPELLERFRAKGPTGILIDDLLVLVQHIVSIKEFTREEAAVARRVVKSEARLMVAAHTRVEAFLDEFITHILEREGQEFGAHRAKLLVTVLACLYDVALRDVLDDDAGGERDLEESYADSLTTLRELLA
ncbi:TetR family transcriptional regulator [Nocardioides sp. AE5]|uniref:TetR family transcriptional regulator n=1 Tax=Nocardioides sp. AE5 TaxID=2962573 RepID=UPI0028828E4F|nr:TetR family transcriptional regulator [Nocardioides sp. AE5]MDT0202371.1 TetR family transcriptional regulator [Nocardioides sp. AE5]